MAAFSPDLSGLTTLRTKAVGGSDIPFVISGYVFSQPNRPMFEWIILRRNLLRSFVYMETGATYFQMYTWGSAKEGPHISIY